MKQIRFPNYFAGLDRKGLDEVLRVKYYEYDTIVGVNNLKHDKCPAGFKQVSRWIPPDRYSIEEVYAIYARPKQLSLNLGI